MVIGCLRLTDVTVMLYDTIMILSYGASFLYEAYSLEERLWMNSNCKMETSQPIENQFGSEFPAICSHCEVMAAWSRIWKFCEQFLLFGKTTHYGQLFQILFRKFTWRYRSTLLCWNVVKFVRREIGEIVRYLLDQNNKISTFPQTVATARTAPKIFQGQLPKMCSCARFTFSGVIAKGVNTVFAP